MIFIWDACRINELPGGENGLRIVQQGIAEQNSGELIMLSASPGEAALENSSYAHGHGLFTYYLIDGLSGAADSISAGGNNDGKVDITELEEWVKRNVHTDALKLSKNQNPKFIYNFPETMSIVDPAFKEDWAMEKTDGENLAVNFTKGSGRMMQTADSLVVKLYNQFMDSVKADNLNNDPNSAESLYTDLANEYPDNDLTSEAAFNLAMEYVNLAQDKINLYISGKDDLKRLASPKKNGAKDFISHKIQIASGHGYSTNAGYLFRAIQLLKRINETDTLYIKQLEAKEDFLLARSYVSDEGIVQRFFRSFATGFQCCESTAFCGL